jgi:predicted peptidase
MTQFLCLRRPGGALFEKTAPPGPPCKNFLLEVLKIALIIGLVLIPFNGGAHTMFREAAELPKKPGIYEETLTLKSGTLLRYTLSIPREFSPGQSMPLVMALHYGGTVTPWYSKGYLMILVEPALRKLNAIIAAPDCPDKGWNNPTSEAAVLELLDHIKTKYSIDDRRLLITGFSMGGIGTWHMVARHPQLFSAAIPMSGTIGLETVKKIEDTPFYVIHSQQDEIFPYKQVEEMVQILKDREVPVQLELIDGISHYNTAGFAEYLRKAVPWIKEIWKK